MVLFDSAVYNFITNIFIVTDYRWIFFFKMATTLGSSIVVCTIIFSLLILFEDKKYFLYTGLACLIGILFESLLKIIIKRPRPTEFWPLASENTYSFPSGHSFIVMVLFGMLIYFTYKEIKNKKIQYLLTGIFSIIILLVGVSRIFLGIHYPTDVVGGYIIGLVFLICYIKLVIEHKDNKNEKKTKKEKTKKRVTN